MDLTNQRPVVTVPLPLHLLPGRRVEDTSIVACDDNDLDAQRAVLVNRREHLWDSLRDLDACRHALAPSDYLAMVRDANGQIVQVIAEIRALDAMTGLRSAA